MLNLKDTGDSVSSEEGRILKPCSAPRDLIDQLVVSFENFLEEVPTEESGKGQESLPGGEKNEYVTSPYRPHCAPGDSPLGRAQHPCPGGPEGSGPAAGERLPGSAASPGPAQVGEEGLPTLYLKNSLTTREFLGSEKLPDQTKREI